MKSHVKVVSEAEAAAITRRYEKDRAAIRHILQGRGFHKALAAMAFAEEFHTGKRRDGVTPEFDHQIQLALCAVDLPFALYPEDTYCTLFLHDVPEDYGVAYREIEQRFGERVAASTANLDKNNPVFKKDFGLQCKVLATDPIASIGKGLDRYHNFDTMPGVFSFAKMKQYIEEAELHILPMLKQARKNFPQQIDTYFMLKRLLVVQIKHDRFWLNQLEQAGASNASPGA